MKFQATRAPRPRWRKVPAICGLFLALQSPAAMARNRAEDVAAELAHALDSTVSAHVVLRRDVLATPVTTTEQYFMEHGCHYDVRDKASVELLLAAIRKAKIYVPETVQGDVDVRSIVELFDSQGRSTRIVFELAADPVGMIEGSVDGKPVKAAAVFNAELQKWARGRSPSRMPPYGVCP